MSAENVGKTQSGAVSLGKNNPRVKRQGWGLKCEGEEERGRLPRQGGYQA